MWIGGGTVNDHDLTVISRFPAEPDLGAVAEAIQVLEHSRLPMRSPGDQSHLGLTRLGRHTVVTNTMRQHLGLGEPPSQA
jgi:hypothetical protein